MYQNLTYKPSTVTSSNFRSNDVTSGSRPVTYVTSCHALPPPASYSPVGAKTYPELDL